MRCLGYRDYSKISGVGILGRFICHFISGIIFFAIYAPEGMNPLLYSAIYNGSYLAIEFIISSLIVYILVRKFPIK